MWFRKLTSTLVLAVAWSAAVAAQITPTNVFSPNTVISSSAVNANFALFQNALNRTGGTITGNITVSAGVTIDGIDLSAWLNQAVLTTSSPTFSALTVSTTLTVSGTGASTLDVGGGLNIGTGNVALVTAAGKITAISSTYFDSLDGTNLTGLAKLGSANTFTARNDFLTYSETKTAPTIGGAALTINLALGTVFNVAANGNATITISNPVPSGSHGSFEILFTQDGTARTFTWPAAVKWANNSAYTAATATGTNTKVDIVACVYNDGGTTYYCAFNTNF